MCKLLLTGARAPVTLDLARNLHKFNHTVYVADCWKFPIARHTNTVSGAYELISPRENLTKFKSQLIHIIRENNIDFLVPTCEEVFYIARIKNELSQYCKVICPDFDLISQLHSKRHILTLAEGCGVGIPITAVFTRDDINEVNNNLNNYIIKREYGRFGVSVWCNLTEDLIDELSHSDQTLLLQQKIAGEEFCTYTIAHNGEVMAHACYQPIYRIQDSASMYFKPIQHEKIEKFVTAFVKRHNISGQVAFDIKEHDNEIYLIECNPRTNSGLHLLTLNDLGAALAGKTKATQVQTQPAMLGYAMWLSSFPRALLAGKIKQWLQDYKAAREVVYLKQDKSLFFYQCLAICEWIYKSCKHRVNLREVSTFDIEWNGDEISFVVPRLVRGIQNTSRSMDPADKPRDDEI